MKETDSITVEFLLADCKNVTIQSIVHQRGVKIGDLLGMLNPKLMEAWEKSGALAINSKLVSEEHVLNLDTRIMILKKLINSPEDLRQWRAKQLPIKKVRK